MCECEEPQSISEVQCLSVSTATMPSLYGPVFELLSNGSTPAAQNSLFLSFSLATNSRIKPLIVHVTLSLNAADSNHVRGDKVANDNMSSCLYQLWAKDLQKAFHFRLLFQFYFLLTVMGSFSNSSSVFIYLSLMIS